MKQKILMMLLVLFTITTYSQNPLVKNYEIKKVVQYTKDNSVWQYKIIDALVTIKCSKDTLYRNNEFFVVCEPPVIYPINADFEIFKFINKALNSKGEEIVISCVWIQNKMHRIQIQEKDIRTDYIIQQL